MLSVTDLTKSFRGFGLHNINFELPQGYLMGLIGPNAAGKSTLIKTILNIYRPDCGTVTINGYDLGKQEHMAKDCVGTVLDENFYEETLSAKSNANLYGRFYSNYSYPRFEAYCRQFNLDPKQKLKSYSKGMHMKFQLAFALSHQAKLLLLDEPTASLDPTFRKELLSILSDLISDGEHSVLLSTHLTEDLDLLADYITLINNGELVFSKNKEDLINTYELITCEPYKLSLLPKDLMIWSETTAYGGKALIRKRRLSILPDGVLVQRPTIEDIMYYMVKGDFKNVETGMV